MPPTVFQCQKLVIWNLDCIYRAVICLDAPQKVSFWSLKNLHLAKVLLFEDKNSLKNLLSGCLVLEELCMELRQSESDFSKNQKFSVISPSLKILRSQGLGHSDRFGSFLCCWSTKTWISWSCGTFSAGFLNECFNLFNFLGYLINHEAFPRHLQCSKLELSTRLTFASSRWLRKSLIIYPSSAIWSIWKYEVAQICILFFHTSTFTSFDAFNLW